MNEFIINHKGDLIVTAILAGLIIAILANKYNWKIKEWF